MTSDMPPDKKSDMTSCMTFDIILEMTPDKTSASNI